MKPAIAARGTSPSVSASRSGQHGASRDGDIPRARVRERTLNLLRFLHSMATIGAGADLFGEIIANGHASGVANALRAARTRACNARAALGERS
jgi:hypothetical protein